ncbi:MAG: acetyl-CoA carboxylase biotin carboxylase subunit, partial [Armatimonadetes bacterium]|nr:acetyl-CoA carboxylase biotin carboxylase subunit [Armatimonadota bacterium]
MFRSVAIANRGEIAVRIIRTLREMGLRAIALYSDPDRDAPHVRLADAAYPLHGSTSAETYLDVEKVIAACVRADAEAVHPGYGFLSENAEFAAAVEQAGLALIGPSSTVIRTMGDKIEARRLMEQAGVPVVPGWSGEIRNPAELIARAGEIGYPLLVKAAAGGGGRGMRRADDAAALQSALSAAQAEAAETFGDGRVFLERYLPRSRHIEFQVFGDRQGSAVHLFERECSIQRRHQKLIEESPSPALNADLRSRMAEAALRAACAVHYENAGTIELILAEDGSFYFLEMNTRLQVEHPVTECLTGRDLVRAQLQAAAGEPLPFSQDELQAHGHALECRVYAEDPERGFLPGAGRIQVYREPAGPGVRVDSGVTEGLVVPVEYDPLLAKVIVWAEDR